MTGVRHSGTSLENMHLSKKFAHLYFNREEMTKWVVASFKGVAP
jgi:hypothetical protein